MTKIEYSTLLKRDYIFLQQTSPLRSCHDLPYSVCPSFPLKQKFPKRGAYTPCGLGCIPCKPHAGGTPVASQVYAKVEGWRTPEVQRLKEPCAEICVLLRPYAKDDSLGKVHAATPTGKLAPHRRSSGLSAWNAPWPVVWFPTMGVCVLCGVVHSQGCLHSLGV